VWGDPSYIKQSMVVAAFTVSPTTTINQSKPTKINGYAYNRVNWTINVKDQSGKIVDSFEVKHEHTLKTQWAPKKEVPNGTYIITADIVTKDGFKVTTTPKQVTVQQ
jgi:lactocepin